MDVSVLISFLRDYALVPLATVFWYLYKKQDTRLDTIEKRTTDTEKAVIEIRTEFKFISRDIKEIKDILTKLSER